MSADIMTTTFGEWLADACEQVKARRVQREAERLAARTPEQVFFEEHARRAAAEAPPFSPERIAKLGALLFDQDPNPMPPVTPVPSIPGGRSVNPEVGTLYGRHLRASAGPCGRCRARGPREVDHCHAHRAVRGLICRSCNTLSEVSMGDEYRKVCVWCQWEMWLAWELR